MTSPICAPLIAYFMKKWWSSSSQSWIKIKYWTCMASKVPITKTNWLFIARRSKVRPRVIKKFRAIENLSSTLAHALVMLLLTFRPNLSRSFHWRSQYSSLCAKTREICLRVRVIRLKHMKGISPGWRIWLPKMGFPLFITTFLWFHSLCFEDMTSVHSCFMRKSLFLHAKGR